VAASSEAAQPAWSNGSAEPWRAGALSAYGETHFAEFAAALLGLLDCDLLPPLSLLTLGWLLHQLLSVGASGGWLGGATSQCMR
jgi:hypothetical protein